MKELEQFKPQLPALSRIISITLPGYPPEVCKDLAEAELMNFLGLAELNPALKKCTKESVISAIKSTLIKGLSLDPNLKLVYVSTRNHKVGNEWITRIEVTDSVNALLWMAQAQGKLISWSQPEVEFDQSGKVSSVSWTYLTPSGKETNEMNATDFERIATFSARQNNGKANALYTSYNGGIDPGFAGTKIMRHASVMKGLNPLKAIRRAENADQYPQVEPVEEIHAIDEPISEPTNGQDLW